MEFCSVLLLKMFAIFLFAKCNCTKFIKGRVVHAYVTDHPLKVVPENLNKYRNKDNAVLQHALTNENNYIKHIFEDDFPGPPFNPVLIMSPNGKAFKSTDAINPLPKELIKQISAEEYSTLRKSKNVHKPYRLFPPQRTRQNSLNAERKMSINKLESIGFENENNDEITKLSPLSLKKRISSNFFTNLNSKNVLGYEINKEQKRRMNEARKTYANGYVGYSNGYNYYKHDNLPSLISNDYQDDQEKEIFYDIPVMENKDIENSQEYLPSFQDSFDEANTVVHTDDGLSLNDLTSDGSQQYNDINNENIFRHYTLFPYVSNTHWKKLVNYRKHKKIHNYKSDHHKKLTHIINNTNKTNYLNESKNSTNTVKHGNQTSKHIKSGFYVHKTHFGSPRVLSAIPHKYYIEKYRTNSDMAYNNIHFLPHKYEDIHNHINSWMIPITTHNYGETFINPCENGGLHVASDHGRNICICPYQYMGTNCQDINYCHPQPCMNGGKCQVTRFGTHYQCDCYKEHLGANCEKTNPCFPNPCQNNGVCTHNSINATCICTNGFKGSRCEEVNSCIPNPCLNGAICYQKPGLGKFECICEADWRGTTCNQPTACSTSPCLNGGKCVDSGENYKCLCNDGFIGRHCDVELCSPNPCKNYGKCFQDGKTFKCLCPEWTKGEFCEVLSPCKLHPCQNHATCIDSTSIYQWNFTPAHYYCKCQPSWTGDHCQVSKCKACSIHAICDGGKCVCEQGYSGNGLVCTKIETPCAPNPCENSGICHDEGSGNYHCICKPGFKPPLCKDTDLCSPNSCNGGVCTLTLDGGFKCTSCPPGFFGVTCRQNDSCFLNPCQHGGHCKLSLLGSHECDCVGFWSGEVCEKCSCPPSMNPLFPSPYCLLTTGQCVCPGHHVWESKHQRCILPKSETIDPCMSSPCLCGGKCIWDSRVTSEYTCLCNERCYGARCEFENACQKDRPCLNGGSCTNLHDGKYKCHCYFGYSGVNCQIPPNKSANRCDINVCLNGGICKPLNQGYDCVCLPRYTGIHCQVDRCRNCDINAKCVHGVCKCLPGWVGSGFECVKEECDSKCVGFQTCVSGVCGCFPGYNIVQNVCMRDRKSTTRSVLVSFTPRTLPFHHKFSTTHKPFTKQKSVASTQKPAALTVTHQPTTGLPFTYMSTVSSNLPATTVPSLEYYDNNQGLKHSNIKVENGLSKSHVVIPAKQNVSEVPLLKQKNNSLKGVSNFTKIRFLNKNNKNIYPGQSMDMEKKSVNEKIDHLQKELGNVKRDHLQKESSNVKGDHLQKVIKNEKKYENGSKQFFKNEKTKYGNKASHDKTIVQQTSKFEKKKDVRKISSVFSRSKNVSFSNVVGEKISLFSKNLIKAKMASRQPFLKSFNITKLTPKQIFVTKPKQIFVINNNDTKLRTSKQKQFLKGFNITKLKYFNYGSASKHPFLKNIVSKMKPIPVMSGSRFSKNANASKHSEITYYYYPINSLDDFRTNIKTASQYGEDSESFNGETNVPLENEVSQDTAAQVSQDTAAQVSQDMDGQVSQDMDGQDSQDMAGQISQDIAGQVSQDMAGQVSQDMDGQVSQDVDGQVSQDMTGQISQDTAGQVSQDIAGQVSQDIAGQTVGSLQNNFVYDYPTSEKSKDLKMSNESLSSIIKEESIEIAKLGVDQLKYMDKDIESELPQGENIQYSSSEGVYIPVYKHDVSLLHNTESLHNTEKLIYNLNESVSDNVTKDASFKQDKVRDKVGDEIDLVNSNKNENLNTSNDKQLQTIRNDTDMSDNDLQKWLKEAKMLYSKGIEILREKGLLEETQSHLSKAQKIKLYYSLDHKNNTSNFSGEDIYPGSDDFTDNQRNSFLASLPSDNNSTLKSSSNKGNSFYKVKNHSVRRFEEKFGNNSKSLHNEESFFAKLKNNASKQINLLKNEELIPSKISDRFKFIKNFKKIFSYADEIKNSQNDTKHRDAEAINSKNDTNNTGKAINLPSDTKNNAIKGRNSLNDTKSDTSVARNSLNDIKTNVGERRNAQINTKIDVDASRSLQSDTKNILKSKYSQNDTQSNVDETKHSQNDTHKNAHEAKYSHNDTHNNVDETKYSQNDTQSNVHETKYSQNDTQNNVDETKYSQNDTQSNVHETKCSQNDTQNNVDETKYSQNDTQSNTDETKYSQNDTQNNVNETKYSHNDTQSNTDETKYSQNDTQSNVHEIKYSQNDTQNNSHETNYSQNDTQNNVNETNYSQNDTQINVDETKYSQNDTQNNTSETKYSYNYTSNADVGRNSQNDTQVNKDETRNFENNTESNVGEVRNANDELDNIDHNLNFEASLEMYENQGTKEFISNMSEHHGTTDLIDNFYDNSLLLDRNVVSLRGIAKSKIPNNRLVLKNPIHLKLKLNHTADKTTIKTETKPIVKVQPIHIKNRNSSFSRVKVEPKKNMKNILGENKANRSLSLYSDQYNTSNKFSSFPLKNGFPGNILNPHKTLAISKKKVNRTSMKKTVEVLDLLKEYGINKKDLIAELNE